MKIRLADYVADFLVGKGVTDVFSAAAPCTSTTRWVITKG